MKKISSILFMAIVMIASLGLTSCGDDNEIIKSTEQIMAEAYAGVYSGTDNINVRMIKNSWDYSTANPVEYRITSNTDGSINISVPEETYTNTQIGDITIGAYTIDSLKFNPLTGYTRLLKGVNTKVHFQATGNDKMPIKLNDDYAFTGDASIITVSRGTDGSISVKNIYTLGKSPVVITNTFKGTK